MDKGKRKEKEKLKLKTTGKKKITQLRERKEVNSGIPKALPRHERKPEV
jgi:hypothetical protein